MPRKDDPGTINVGTGVDPSQKNAQSLTGLGAPPYVGNVTNPTNPPSGLSGHTLSGVAHPASAITIDGIPSFYFSSQVDGALDEIGALLPPQPPAMGNFVEYLGHSGIPDWGILKLNDGPLTHNDSTNMDITSNSPDSIYPYYFHPPHPAQVNPPFEPVGTTILVDRGGNDPVTDSTFNVWDGSYPGGGQGKTHAATFTRSGTAIQTLRALDFDGAGSRQVLVSGAVFPADRGVLALLHIPAGGDLTDFLAQNLTDRCLAALLLGQGCLGTVCDGKPGGIFAEGSTNSVFDPYAFPGLASGQYDLAELHQGIYETHVGAPLSGTPLPAPYNDLDGDTVQGAPAAGQVRLGTDPNAGVAVVANGIPILGGTSAARGGGNDNNFFRYRLPYLLNYQSLSYTPSAQRPRYYKKPTISLNPGTDLTLAGDYSNFPKDYWVFQVARFRHAFTLLTGVSPRESGSYVLVHFKTEEAFEKLVRDGVAPTDDLLYSANMVNWSDSEHLDNYAPSAASTSISSSYHITRSAIIEDQSGLTALSTTTSTFTIPVAAIPTVVQISGVQYFLPRDQAGNPAYQIDSLDVQVDDIWENTYRVFDDTTQRNNTPNPLFLYMGAFCYSTENANYIEVPVGLVTNASQVRKQRIEFQLQDLGAYTLGTPPDPVDNATISVGGGDTIDFAGDTNTPAFSADARIRIFVRKPLGNQSATDYDATSLAKVLDRPGGNTIMVHTTRYLAAGNPVFGNFISGGKALSSLETSDKDTQERFLDEVYRYLSTWDGLAGATQSNLIGPGLPNPPSAILVPVRAGRTSTAGYDTSSWVQTNAHTTALPGDALQVAGTPDRNPPVSEGVQVPIPSSGVLIYPQKDYSTNYRPSIADTGTDQPDYSVFTGDRDYVRAFDLSFSRSGSPKVMVGESSCILKILGVKLEDFVYTAPGVGKNIAILAKVPGLTSWMDVGRLDGSGPGKQDNFSDGAGCQVSGPDTFDGVDTTTGLNYCQVKIHVGPTVAFFENADGEVPLLIKVLIRDNATAKNFNLEYDFVNTTTTPNARSRDVRGICQIEIVR